MTAIVVHEPHLSETGPSTYACASFAKALAERTGEEIIIAALSRDRLAYASSLAERTGFDTIACNMLGAEGYSCEAIALAIEAVIDRIAPRWIIAPASSQGSEWAPFLAGRLGVDCITNVSGIEPTPGGPGFISPIQGGKFVRVLAPQRFPVIITIQPGAFPWEEEDAKARGRVIPMDIDLTHMAWTREEYLPSQESDSRLKEASVVIAAGRGLGSEEGLETIKAVAALFSRSAIGGSRPVCDMGWRPYSCQVGQTGLTVAPDLYMACGISGAQQHILGMCDSKLVVAVNTDPNAAIFKHSDICVVEDLHRFLKEFISQVEKDK